MTLEEIKAMDTDTIKATDVGKVLGVCPQSIRVLSQRGQLPFAFSIGSRCIIPRLRFIAYMEGKIQPLENQKVM